MTITFSECRKKFSKYNAYSGWITVEDAKLRGDIPPEYHAVFADKCECGSDNIIAPNLKREMCCDPKCPIKESYKLSEMFSRFGKLGLGYASCARIYNTLRNYDQKLKNAGEQGLFMYNAYTEVLMIPWEKYPSSIKDLAIGWDFFAACLEIRQHRMTFAQLVGSLGLTSLGSNSEKLFDGIDSFVQLSNSIKECGGVIPFCVRRGVGSPEIIFNIANALEDIAVAEFACRGALRRAGINKMSICITGSVKCNGISVTKANFINACNEVCIDSDGVPMLEIKNTSAVASVPFILYTNASSSAKYDTGKSRGKITDEFGTHEVLITTSQFYNWLKGAISEWNNRKNLPGADWIQILSETLMTVTSQKTDSSEKMTSEMTDSSEKMTSQKTILLEQPNMF